MIVQFFVLFLLILINGVFSASEIAFLSINKIKLNHNVKLKNKKAIKIDNLMKNPSGFLATIQIVITLAGFLASAFAADAYVEVILGYFSFIDVSQSILKTIIVVFVTIILSYFTLVFGELVPKRIGMYYPEKIAYGMVNIIDVIMKIVYPFIFLLTKSTNFVTKLIGIKATQEAEKLTEEEIKMIISHGNETGAIESLEKDLIFNVFDFNDTEIKEIMKKRDKVVHIDVNIDFKRLTKLLREYKYTRLPVYENDCNNIIGVLNVKDIIVFFGKREKFDIRKILRKPFFVDENEKIDDVFKCMQKNRQCMGIVMKEKKEFIGIVTTEDAIEEIVGTLFNEYDLIT